MADTVCRRSVPRLLLAALLALAIALLTAGSAQAAAAADTRPPGPVTAFKATGGSGQIALAWTNPAVADLTGVLLVRKTGTVAPTTPTDGLAVAKVLKPAHAYPDRLLDAGTTYSYAAFAYDTSGNYSKATVARAATAAAPPAVVHLSGVLAADLVLTPKKAKLFLVDSRLTVPAGRTLTVGPGAVVKVRDGIAVAGTLRTTGTSTAKALLTTFFDDAVAGNSPGSDGTAAANLFDVAPQAVCAVSLAGADLRYSRIWNYDVAAGGAAVTVTGSALKDVRIELAYGQGTAVRFTGNTFSRSVFYLAQIAAPVVSGNTFADGAPFGSGQVTTSPFYLTAIGDLAGVGANTATGTPTQRLMVIVSSSVTTSWTLQPGVAYGLADVTVQPGATMTLAAGSLVKALSGATAINVAGTLRSTGTASVPAVVTTVDDDAIGGDSNPGATPNNNPYAYDLSLLTGGTITLDRAQITRGRIWNYHADSGTVTVTGSAIKNSMIELAYGQGTAVRFTGNTFSRSAFYLAQIARPVVSGNTFADGAPLGFGYLTTSPVWVGQADDLSGFGANTATGTADQRLFQLVSSSVRGAWTLQPGYTYALADVTVQGGGSLNATSGTVMRNVGTLGVLSGGSLSANGVTIGALQDSNYQGISAKVGSSVSISGSTLTGATYGVEANPDWLRGSSYATVSVLNSSVTGGTIDITNGFKDVPWGAAVDAAGTVAGNVSSHQHLCMPPPDSPAPVIVRTLWDVEGTAGRTDSPGCPPLYEELDGHPSPVS